MDTTHIMLDQHVAAIAADRQADGARNRAAREQLAARRARRWGALQGLLPTTPRVPTSSETPELACCV